MFSPAMRIYINIRKHAASIFALFTLLRLYWIVSVSLNLLSYKHTYKTLVYMNIWNCAVGFKIQSNEAAVKRHFIQKIEWDKCIYAISRYILLYRSIWLISSPEFLRKVQTKEITMMTTTTFLSIALKPQ